MGADNDSHWKTEELFMKKKRKLTNRLGVRPR